MKIGYYGGDALKLLEDLKELRLKQKPGCIPPYVSLDRKGNVESVLQSEREYLEEKLKDINDNFTMIVPELVKQIFPVISHINVFMFIKKIESYKYKLIMDLRNIKNEIRYISYKYK